jgi:hypothetical protein
MEQDKPKTPPQPEPRAMPTVQELQALGFKLVPPSGRTYTMPMPTPAPKPK